MKTKSKLKTFQVRLEKSYIKLLPPDDYDYWTIYGTMPVKAKSQEEANAKVEKMLTFPRRGELQSNDPRIAWEDEPDNDWECEDFSFSLA